jgi:poly-gamma-glutamate synthesis protein (capsule biosynthesis protein)
MRNLVKYLLFILILSFPALCAYGEDEEFSLTELLPATEETAAVVPADDGAQPSFFEEDGSVLITLTATGDVTIGSNYRASGKSIFERELEKQKNDIHFPFRNFKEIFEADDLTLINFEGTLTTVARPPSNKAGNDYLFKAPPEYVALLAGNSVEAVALENNHVNDFGAEGLAETKAVLSEAGIVYACEGEPGIITVKGVQIALLAYQTFDAYDRLFEQVPREVAEAKSSYPIVIVSFHWGAELDYKPNANQQRLGKAAVDAGADLVLGHHSHRVNPIEEYNGKYIVYSLGNFSFAGNSKPSDMSTFIFQMRFRVRDGVAAGEGFRIIPARISSRSDTNDFAPTPYDKQVSIDSLISVLKKNGASLSNPVAHYPLAFPK